ncbi:MAG: AMP-binding protein [Alphaproteobacteria bacterium]|nr:AMP-binding protein [Alphaproteobacteria bacterium]
MSNPRPTTIPHAAMAAAERWGDLPAVLENGEVWTFGRLWAECRRAASAFLTRGISRGDRIAIWAPNCRAWIVVAIGAMMAGAAIVPLNTRLKGREAGDILRRARVRMLFTVQVFLGVNYRELIAAEELPALQETVHVDSDFPEFMNSGMGADDPAVIGALARIKSDDISDIMFTSGTTGVPKGVMATHSRVVEPLFEWIANTGLASGERYLIVSPFFHSFGYKAGWVVCLLAGAVIVPMAQFDPYVAADVIERERISFMPGAPTIFQALLAERKKRSFDTSSLRGGTTGAAVVAPTLIRRIRDELGMPDIITAYGMTECTTITCCRRGDHTELIAETCGIAIAGSEVRITDDTGRELPRGETGEILVRGNGVMLGYLDDPAATAEAIDVNGWLHTGDIGTMDAAGYVRITDRKKDMYISGGFNCYPAEVEKLLAAHPAIEMVAVTGVPDERLGEVGKAWIVLRAGATLNEAALIAWSRENMANYKVPKSVTFLNDLPRNAAGKVSKRELR